MTNEQPDIYVPLLPEICRGCGDEMLVKIKRETEMFRIAQHCPHNDVLLYASMGVYQDTRAVLRWAVLGPISQEEAMVQINEMAEKHGAEIHTLLDPNQLN